RRDMKAIRADASPEVAAILDRLDSHDTRFAAASANVQQLYEEGDLERATNVHISADHEISHDLEDELTVLINLLSEEAGSEQAAFQDSRRFLTTTVAGFSYSPAPGHLPSGATCPEYWPPLRALATHCLAMPRR